MIALGQVINAGDAVEFLSGGLCKATIHLVVQPPADQRDRTRLGLFYVYMADDAVKLAPLLDNPVPQREGVLRRFNDEEAPIRVEWRKGVTRAYGQTKLVMQDMQGTVEQETVLAVVVRHFN